MIPKLFSENMREVLDADEADALLLSLSAPLPVSVRQNSEKKNNLLTENKIPWCSTGFYLDERPLFTLDPLFHAGCYYVQEASSMFLEQIIKQLTLDKIEIKALDLCAAPGGKTTHLLSLLNKNSLVVSNEVIRSRVNVLKENVIKWGYANCFVTNNDAKDFAQLQNYFDVIVCDAPCSGEGLFRKDKEAVKHWSTEAVEHCSQRQKKIIADVLPALKPGGYLIYSTCTFNKTENENIAEWLINEFDLHTVDIDILQFPGIVKHNSTIRFYPHKIKGEGFTIAVLQKQDAEFNQVKYPRQDGNFKTTSTENDIFQDENFIAITENNTEIYLQHNHLKEYLFLKKHLNLVHYGIPAFEIKGKDKVPQHPLAMNIHLNKNYFPEINLSRIEALHYLKGETNFSFNVAEGYHLAAFENVPLGFLKKIKDRFNNLYPRNWFIRMNINA